MASKNQQKIGLKYVKLPLEIEEELVRCIVDKTLSKVSFKKICDERKIFGPAGSELRKRVQKRREYLLQNPVALHSLAKKILGHTFLTPPIVFNSPSPKKLSDPRELFPLVTPLTERRPQPQLESPPRTRIMPEDEGDIPTFRLNFDHPWKSPCNGMFAVKGVQWEDPRTMQVVDKLSLYKPIYDIKDFQEGRYSARLSSDGTGIYCVEPTIPHFLWTSKDRTSIQAIVDGGDVCNVTDKSYKITTTRLQENKEFRTTEVYYAFPKGVTCNNEHFNKDDKGMSPPNPFHLLTKMHLQQRVIGTSTDSGDDIYDFMPFVVWKVAIDGLDARTQPKKDGKDNGLSDALKSLGITLGTNMGS
jgi:hypothetical protein